MVSHREEKVRREPRALQSGGVPLATVVGDELLRRAVLRHERGGLRETCLVQRTVIDAVGRNTMCPHSVDHVARRQGASETAHEVVASRARPRALR